MNAAQLRARGFSLCKPDPAEKKPTYRGWSTRSLEPADFRPGDAVGILGGPLSACGKPGHAIVIIDLDAAEAVRLADKFLPETECIEGRPGKLNSHRYFLVPCDSIPDWGVSRADQAAPAAIAATGHAGPFVKSFRHRETNAEVMRFIGTGGQAVCPPSMHHSGEQREWAGDVPGEPAVVEFLDLWRRVCELASACGCEIPNVMPRRTERANTSTPVLERARKYLGKIPEAVSGADGHGQLLTAARAMVWGFDLAADDAFELLANGYNSRCVPPWSDWELRHKIDDADRVPFDKPRGYLLNAERSGKATTPPKSAPKAADNGPRTAAQEILEYFRERYRPDFRRRGQIHCESGEFLSRTDACDVPTSELIERLASCTDAPTFPPAAGGGIKRSALPAFFKTWGKVAWGDLLESLPDELSADLDAGTTAAEEFKRAVRDSLLSEVVLGDVIEGTTVTQTERRSVIDFAAKFAKPGPWRSIRSKKCWCRATMAEGELTLHVAIRVELFAQLKGNKRLCELTQPAFARLCDRYGIGESTRTNRPEGFAAVTLSPAFLAELTQGLPGDDDTQDDPQERPEEDAELFGNPPRNPIPD